MKQWMISGLLAVTLLAGCRQAPVLPPLSDSGVSLPGKFIWRDLVTPDPGASEAFYRQLFGWEFEPLADSGYSLIRNAGVVVGGMVDANRIGEPVKSALWLSALSTPDVRDAVRYVRSAGGQVLHRPTSLPSRGRFAVVMDREGAVFQLIESSGGDPVDAEPTLNSFFWAEMIAADPDEAAAFYRGLFGYEVQIPEAGSASSYRLLMRNDRPRAGIVANPFEETRSAWIPCVRVEQPAELAARAVALGGRVVVEPRDDVRKGTLALILDPTGAPLALQRWSPATGGGQP